MTRALLLGFVLLTAACGNKSPGSMCGNQVPPPAACMTACDSTPGAQNTCPAGFHCATDGKCDKLCTPTGNECGDGYSCTADGDCMSNGGGPPPIDADCPAAHFTAMPITPSIQLLIDRSGSMLHDFADQARTGPTDPDPEKYQTVQDALVGAQGVVTQLQGKVYFGATLFSADANVACPTLKTTGRLTNNKAAIETLIAGNRPEPNARTPTPPSIDMVVADFKANKPPQGSPQAIVLATDGLPNECGSDTSTVAESVVAAQNAFMHGIKLFILGVGTIPGAAQHLQAMANAGQGVTPGPDQPDAKAFTATNPTQLAAAFQEIIRGVVSCDLTLSHQVNATDGQGGTVTLNGNNLTYGTDWTLDADGLTIHLLGAACDMLKMADNPMLDATFACGAVIF